MKNISDRIKDFLDAHPGESFQGHLGLATAMGENYLSVKDSGNLPPLADYRTRTGTPFPGTRTDVLWAAPGSTQCAPEPEPLPSVPPEVEAATEPCGCDDGCELCNEEIAALLGEESDEEVSHLRDLSGFQKKALRAAQNQILRLREKLASRRELASQVIGNVEPLVFTPPTLNTGTGTTGTMFASFTDWHIGEKVDRDEMGGVNEFNWDVARTGMENIVSRIVKWLEVQRRGTKIDDAVIFVLGDMIGGAIHEELAANAEFPPAVATARAAELLSHAISALSPQFKKVRVLCVAGNHDRMGKKVAFKRTNEDSLAHLCYTIASERLRDHENVEFLMPVDSMPVIDVHGSRFAALHGHQIKAGGISPYYGINRLANSISREHLGGCSTPPDHIIMGHFHHYALLEDTNVILSPSLIGATEWSRQKGFRGKPGQLVGLVKERGILETTVFERRTGR